MAADYFSAHNPSHTQAKTRCQDPPRFFLRGGGSVGAGEVALRTVPRISLSELE